MLSREHLIPDPQQRPTPIDRVRYREILKALNLPTLQDQLRFTQGRVRHDLTNVLLMAAANTAVVHGVVENKYVSVMDMVGAAVISTLMGFWLYRCGHRLGYLNEVLSEARLRNLKTRGLPLYKKFSEETET